MPVAGAVVGSVAVAAGAFDVTAAAALGARLAVVDPLGAGRLVHGLPVGVGALDYAGITADRTGVTGVPLGFHAPERRLIAGHWPAFPVVMIAGVGLRPSSGSKPYSSCFGP